MKTLSLSALVATFALAALPSPQTVQASTGIQRCTQPDGGVVYTDKACGAFGAQNTPIPGAMMTRLLATMPDEEPESEGSQVRMSARRSLSSGCARTPTQLEADLRGSFALGDANRIAESFHWTGLSNTQGQQIMRRLQSLGERPIRDVHYFNAQIASLSMEDASLADEPAWRTASSRIEQDAAGSLQLQLGGSGTMVIDLDVERYAGCYFVRF